MNFNIAEMAGFSQTHLLTVQCFPLDHTLLRRLFFSLNGKDSKWNLQYVMTWSLHYYKWKLSVSCLKLHKKLNTLSP